MKPDVALSLSFDGIRLLVRTAEGATSLGEVSLDSPDLTGDLAALLRRGREAEVPWTGTTLLLPPEQVKVLALDGERGEVEVLKALDGTTPYSLADLVVDFRAAQGRTHVAAVARETLEEAEAFAAGHGFQPVRFAALLEAFGFPGEADFGPTRLALSAGATGHAGRAGVGAVATVNAPVTPMDELVGSANVDGGPREAPLDAMHEQAADSGPFPAQGEAVVAASPLTGAGTSQARQRAGTVSAPAEVATPVGEPAPGPGTSSDRPAARRDHSTRSGSDVPIRAPLAAPEPARTQGEPTRRAEGASRPLRRIPFAAASPRGRRARAARFGGLSLKRSLESFAAPVAGRRWTSALVLTPVIVAALSAAGIVAAVGLGPVAGLLRGSALVDSAAAPLVEAAPAAAALAVAAPEVATAATLLDEPVSGSARVRPAAGGFEAAAPAAGTVDAAVAAAAAAAVAAALATEPAQEASLVAERVVQQAVVLPAVPGSVGPTAADRSAATTGVWLSAPRLPVLPSGSRDEETAPSVVATSEAKALSDLPLLAGLSPDPSPSWPSDAPASGTESEQPVLAAAEPEAAPSTSSVVVEAGSPAVVPPSRPGGLGPVADGVTPSEWINALVEPPAVLPRARPDVSAEVLAALRLRSANGEDGTENPADGAPAPAASGTELAAAVVILIEWFRE